MNEEWEGFGRRVDAHLTVIDQELVALRQTLRAAGIRVRVQRVRITRENERAQDALAVLRGQPGEAWRPAEVARHLGISPEYAYDLLAALVAEGLVVRVKRGYYRAEARK